MYKLTQRSHFILFYFILFYFILFYFILLYFFILRLVTVTAEVRRGIKGEWGGGRGRGKREGSREGREGGRVGVGRGGGKGVGTGERDWLFDIIVCLPSYINTVQVYLQDSKNGLA